MNVKYVKNLHQNSGLKCFMLNLLTKIAIFLKGEAPSIISRIEDIEVEPSASIVLECQVRGHPKPKVTWLKDGEEVSGPRYR